MGDERASRSPQLANTGCDRGASVPGIMEVDHRIRSADAQTEGEIAAHRLIS